MFVGRDKEIEKLERIYKQDGLHIVLLGGKKGVGKTTLLEEFCKHKRNIFFTASEYEARTNLPNLSRMIREYFNDEDTSQFTFPFWKIAFSYLYEKNKDKRIILVIDNLSNATEKSLLIIKYLQEIPEQELIMNNMMLIISTNDEHLYNSLINSNDIIAKRIYAAIFIDKVSDEDIQKLLMNVDKANIIRFSEDEIVLREGEINKDIYKIISGHAVYYFNYGTDRELVVGGLKEGNMFGEYSLLTGKPGIYTVVAESELLLLRVSWSEIEKFVSMDSSNFKDIMSHMAKMLNVMKINTEILYEDISASENLPEKN